MTFKTTQVLLDNLPLFAAVFVILILAAWLYIFLTRPSDDQITAVKAWLLLAVTNAERDLGGGTGKLKLRQVYDLFIQRFPYIARWISFDIFSGWVDEALDEMKRLLTSNQAIQDYINHADKPDAILSVIHEGGGFS